MESNTSNTVTSLIAEASDDSASTDFEMARANIHEMVEAAKTAVFELSRIAQQSQHPTAYDVLSKLIQTTVNANESLMKLQLAVRKLQDRDRPIIGIQSSPDSVTNNLFVGSTMELQRLIFGLKKQQDMVIDSEPLEEKQ